MLTGAGGFFSAGMDLKAFLRGETPAIEGRGLCGITVTPPRKPLVAAVEGWALAGGFELVLACDLVVAGRTARFGVPEVTRSLVAAGGAALLLPQRVPRAVALEMLLTGEPIDAERAAAVGLVNRVVDEGAALDAAVELADGDRGERPAGRGGDQADRAVGAVLGRRRARRTRSPAGVRLGTPWGIAASPSAAPVGGAGRRSSPRRTRGPQCWSRPLASGIRRERPRSARGWTGRGSFSRSGSSSSVTPSRSAPGPCASRTPSAVACPPP